MQIRQKNRPPCLALALCLVINLKGGTRMKKTITAIFAVILCVGMAVTVSATAFQEDQQAKYETIYAGESIKEYYGVKTASDVLFIGNTLPDKNFGGYYRDADGNLVVNIVGSGPRDVFGLKADLQNIKFVQVKYPLSTLEKIVDTLVPHMREYGISLLDANDITNKIDIKLKDFSNKNISAIKEFLSMTLTAEEIIDMLNFIDGAGSVNLCLGEKID